MKQLIFVTLILLIGVFFFFFFTDCKDDELINNLDEVVLTAKSEQNSSLQSPSELFNQRCKPCHGLDATHHALSKSAVIRNWSAAQIETALLAYKKGKRDSKGMGKMMHGQASALSTMQIKNLAEYIAHLPK